MNLFLMLAPNFYIIYTLNRAEVPQKHLPVSLNPTLFGEGDVDRECLKCNENESDRLPHHQQRTALGLHNLSGLHLYQVSRYRLECLNISHD